MARDDTRGDWDYELSDWGASERARAVPVEFDYDGYEGYVWE